MKRIIALTLALLLALCCLSGCGESSSASSPDTVMTVNGSEVSWDEYVYWLGYAANQLAQKYSYAGTAIDYTNEEDLTLIFKSAKEAVTQQHVIFAKAAELGVEADETEIEELIQNYIKSYCGEDATEEDLEAILKESYLTLDTFKLMLRANMLYSDIIDSMYGEAGADIPDEDIQGYASTNGYVTATHILLMTIDDEGNAVSDSEKEKLKAQAQGFVDELNTIDDTAKRLERFNELKTEFCEDTGKVAYPDGYCFTTGTMVEAFDTAARALNEYAVSEVIETEYGYHVIMRLPLTGDDLCQGADGYPTKLRTLVAENLFTVEFDGWAESATADFVGKYKSYPFEGLFDEEGFHYMSYAESTSAEG